MRDRPEAEPAANRHNGHGDAFPVRVGASRVRAAEWQRGRHGRGEGAGGEHAAGRAPADGRGHGAEHVWRGRAERPPARPQHHHPADGSVHRGHRQGADGARLHPRADHQRAAQVQGRQDAGHGRLVRQESQVLIPPGLQSSRPKVITQN